jgi:DNA repair protein RadC
MAYKPLFAAQNNIPTSNSKVTTGYKPLFANTAPIKTGVNLGFAPVKKTVIDNKTKRTEEAKNIMNEMVKSGQATTTPKPIISKDNPFFKPVDTFKTALAPVVTEKPSFAINTKTEASTPQLAKGYKPLFTTPKVLDFKVGEGIDKTVEVLPGPRKTTLEAIQRGDKIKVVPIGSQEKPISEASQAKQNFSEFANRPVEKVGVDIKVPGMQKSFQMPNDVGELYKYTVELPEKVYQSLKPSYTKKISESGKMPERKELYQVVTYQEELQNMLDSGMNPVTAFTMIGSLAILDIAALGDQLRPVAQKILSIPITKKEITNLTYEDLFKITKGEILDANKMAAFNKASQDGIDWVKVMKENKQTVPVESGKQKTLGDVINEQYSKMQPGLSVKDITKKSPDEIKKYFNTPKTDIEAKTINHAINNINQIARDYSKKAKEMYGFDNVISADEVKKIIPGYHGSLAGEYHEASSGVAKILYDEAIPVKKGQGNNTILFTSGGTGSGKSTALKSVGVDLKEYPIVYDTNLTGFESAKLKIQKALDNGYKVQIDYVHRNPINAFEEGVIPRVAKENRIITVDEHVARHRDALPVLERLKQYFGDKIDVGYIDNTGAKGTAKYVDNVDNLPKFSYNEIETNKLKQKLYDTTDTAYGEGKITELESGRIKGQTKTPSMASGQFEPQRISGGRGAEETSSKVLDLPDPVKDFNLPAKENAGFNLPKNDIKYNNKTNNLIESYAKGEDQIHKLEELQSTIDAQEDPKKFKEISELIDKEEIGNKNVVKQIAKLHNIDDYDAIGALSSYIDIGKRRGKRTVEDFYKWLPDEKVEDKINNIKAEDSNYYEKISNSKGKDIHVREANDLYKSPLKLKFKKTGSFTFADETIKSPADVAFAFKQLKSEAVEKFYVVGIKKNKPATVECISVGTLSASLVHPREVLGLLLQKKCDTAYFVHNHPSGNIDPSAADLEVSKRLTKVLENLDMKYGGHVVIDTEKFGFIDNKLDWKQFRHTEVAKNPTKISSYRKYIEWLEDKAYLKKFVTSDPRSVYEIIKGINLDKKKNALILYLDARNQVIKAEAMPINKIGTPDIFKNAVLNRSASVIIGNFTPVDVFAYRGLKTKFQDLGIELVDIVKIDDLEAEKFTSLSSVWETGPEYKKLTPEEQKAIMEETFKEEISQTESFSGEMENQYQNFKTLSKKLYGSYQGLLDKAEDITSIENKAAEKSIPQNVIDNVFYSQDLTGNEILEKFKERLRGERVTKFTTKIEQRRIVKNEIRKEEKILIEKVKKLKKEKGLSNSDYSKIKGGFNIKELKNATPEQIGEMINFIKKFNKTNGERLLSKKELDSLKDIYPTLKNKLTLKTFKGVIEEYGHVIPPMVRGKIHAPILDFKSWKGGSYQFTLSRETMERNIEDIASKDAEKVKDFLIRPHRVNETERTIWVNNKIKEYAKLSKDLNIKPRSRDDILVQIYGEKRMVQEKIREFIINIEKKFRLSKYNDLISARLSGLAGNKEMAEIPKNIQEKIVRVVKEIEFKMAELSQLGELGILKQESPKNWKNVVKAADYFRNDYDKMLDKINEVRKHFEYSIIPKRKEYFRHFNEMTSIYDFKGMAELLHSEDLPLGLAGETELFRPGKPFTTTEISRKGIRTTFTALGGMDNYLSAVSRQIFLTDSLQRVRALEAYMLNANFPQGSLDGLSAFKMNLKQFGDVIANKKSIVDRSIEGIFGRVGYKFLDLLRRQTGANMIAGNVSSAIMNFIPFTESLATTSKKSAARGLIESLITPFKKDFSKIGGVTSKFLIRRYPDFKIAPTLIEKGADKARWLFEVIDKFSGKTVVAGKYFENLDKGMLPEQAMLMADEYANKVLASRSVGEMPVLVESKTLGFLTQFQLEVNNIYSFLKKDIPNMSDHNIKKMVNAFAQFILYSWVINNIYENLTGRRPTLDFMHYGAMLLGVSNDVEDLNLFERFKKTANEFAGNIPFVGGLTTGGRFPIAAGIPDWKKLGKGDVVGGLKPTAFYLAPPFGGGQVKKTTEGLQAFNKGQVNSASGKTKLFNIEKNASNFFRSILFGKWSTPESNTYWNKPVSNNSSMKNVTDLKEDLNLDLNLDLDL